jgi:hypothetical protein
MIFKFHRCAIRPCPGTLIPPAQFPAQSGREEMLDLLVDSGGVCPFERLKQIVCGDRRTHLAQIPRSRACLDELAVITFLKL